MCKKTFWKITYRGLNYGEIAFLKIKMSSGKIIKHHNIKLKFPHSLIRDN